MEAPYHDFSDLFAQLGLPLEPGDIQLFLDAHSPLPSHIRLQDAHFWTPSQATSLLEWTAEDADWSILVDKLDTTLRAK